MAKNDKLGSWIAKMNNAHDTLKKTDNNYGFMSLVEPPDFKLAYSMMSKSLPVLDMGCAYGFTSKIMLAAGLDVIANDLSASQLDTLAKEVNDETQASKYTGKLTLRPGNALELTFDNGSLGGVVCFNMMHFLSGDQIRSLFAKIYSWLAKDGVAVLSIASPVLADDSLVVKYYADLDSGVEWPGEISMSVVSSQLASQKATPDAFHFNGIEVMIREALRVNFRIFKAGYVNFDFKEATALDQRVVGFCILIKS